MGQFYLLPRLTGPFEEFAEEVVEELEPINHLQVALLQAAMPPNDWLIHGDPAERQQFSQLSRKVDQVFEKARAAPFAQAEERALVESAQKEWREAQLLGAAILRLRHPVGNREGARDMKRFDVHVDRAVALLDRVYDRAHEEIMQDLAVARAAKSQAVFLKRDHALRHCPHRRQGLLHRLLRRGHGAFHAAGHAGTLRALRRQYLP